MIVDFLYSIYDEVLLIICLVLGRNYLFAYTGKKGENLATKEDIREITEEIEKGRIDYTKEIERLRSDLTKENHRHTVKFEHEFKILTELWKAAKELQVYAGSLRPRLDLANPEESADERKKERLEKFREAARDAARAIEDNLPFYPEGIYEQAVKLFQGGRR